MSKQNKVKKKVEKKGNEEIKERFLNFIGSKINHMFADTLEKIESETSKFGVKSEFFAKGNTKSGFGLIRKSLLDHGNDIKRAISVLLSKLDLTIHGSIIELSDSVLKEEQEKTNV